MPGPALPRPAVVVPHTYSEPDPMQAKQRQSWVDIAKGIGILLVVYGHVARGVFNTGIAMDEGLFRLVDSLIYSFHMPLFFFISGLFFLASLQAKGRGGVVAAKTDAILYPYLIWSLLQGFVEVFLAAHTNGQARVSDVLALLWQPRQQFWFLYALFLISLTCALVYRRDSSRRFLVVMSLAFLVAYLFRDDIHLGLQGSFVAGNAVFFALGVLARQVDLPGRLASSSALVLSAGLFAASQYVYHRVLGLDYASGGPLFLANALFGIAFVTALSVRLSALNARWLAALGAASMAIYLMHVLAGGGCRILMKSLLGIDDASAHLVLGTLLGTLLPLAAFRVATRWRLGFLFAPPRAVSAAAWHKRVHPAGTGC